MKPFAHPVRVFWQPGCTSCLKTKEFLEKNGVPFESINVMADPAGLAALRALGMRGVPVVAVGDEAVYSQSLVDVSKFLGLDVDFGKRLDEAELATRLSTVLVAALRYLDQLPDELLQARYRDRDRTMRVLVHHIFRIAESFLEVAEAGPVLSYELEAVLREPGDDIRGKRELEAYGRSVLVRLDLLGARGLARLVHGIRVQTFYGEQSLHAVLELTTRHCTQHIRQLLALMEEHGLAIDRPLGPAEFAGLPLPDKVWEPMPA